MEAVEQIEDEEQREGDEDREIGQFITDWSLLGPFYTQKSHDLDQDFLLEQGVKPISGPVKGRNFVTPRTKLSNGVRSWAGKR